MDVTDSDLRETVADPMGRLWILRRLWPYIRLVLRGLLPHPDPFARHKTRRAAGKLVTLQKWPEMAATSEEVAQLAMLRALDLQKNVRRAATLRQGEAAAMLARSAVEVLFLGLYCVREPEAVGKLHAGNLKAVADALAMAAASGIVTEEVIRECIAALGEPAKRYLAVREMVDAIDKANGNTAALSLYRTLYGPMSNFTVHASGGTLLRHVGRNGKLRNRPSRSWSKRSAMHVADAVTGALACQLARHQKKPDDDLARYMNRHIECAIVPLVFMALSGIRAKAKPRALRESAAMIKDVYRYLWKGQAAAESHEARAAYVRERFAAMLNIAESDLPPGALDPFTNHVAEMMADLVDRLPEVTTPATPAIGSDLGDMDAA